MDSERKIRTSIVLSNTMNSNMEVGNIGAAGINVKYGALNCSNVEIGAAKKFLEIPLNFHFLEYRKPSIEFIRLFDDVLEAVTIF